MFKDHTNQEVAGSEAEIRSAGKQHILFLLICVSISAYSNLRTADIGATYSQQCLRTLLIQLGVLCTASVTTPGKARQEGHFSPAIPGHLEQNKENPSQKEY